MSVEEKKSSGKKREAEVMLQRKKPDHDQPGQTITIPYQIIDNPLRLGPADWYVAQQYNQLVYFHTYSVILLNVF